MINESNSNFHRRADPPLALATSSTTRPGFDYYNLYIALADGSFSPLSDAEGDP